MAEAERVRRAVTAEADQIRADARQDAIALLDTARAEAIARTKSLYEAARKEVQARLAQADAGRRPAPATAPAPAPPPAQAPPTVQAPATTPARPAKQPAATQDVAGGLLDPSVLDLKGVWAKKDPKGPVARQRPA